MPASSNSRRSSHSAWLGMYSPSSAIFWLIPCSSHSRAPRRFEVLPLVLRDELVEFGLDFIHAREICLGRLLARIKHRHNGPEQVLRAGKEGVAHLIDLHRRRIIRD